ncbi:hypothetical protein KBTX_00104 [wastewater metagenome]|uniref:DUF2946 domain-containing protein n=2 Tax=unclassified sequences TaxID=12908 RepID=A0A5B8R8N3_9ZZZZ|nr:MULTISPECIES: DUF2946 family protein [Arhodomonas]QEA03804.1 hypothetical protein KBTEX_00104 [uncultured organism]
MDDSVRRAMARWPDVPALAGWLRLDRRGRWWIDGGLVEREALAEFIARNYLADDKGRYYFQNGPQRVYVSLDYTPWILHADGRGGLATHTGDPVNGVSAAFIDEAGDTLLAFDRGVGLLLGDAAEWLASRLCRADGAAADADAVDAGIEAAAAGGESGLCVVLDASAPAPLAGVRRTEVPARFGFVAEPSAD